MINAKMKLDATIFFYWKMIFFHKDIVVICHIYPSNLFKKERFIYLLIPLTSFLWLSFHKKNISFFLIHHFSFCFYIAFEQSLSNKWHNKRLNHVVVATGSQTWKTIKQNSALVQTIYIIIFTTIIILIVTMK